MPTFAFVARDPAGRRVTGELAGASQQAVLSELQSRSLAPVEVRAVRDRRRGRRIATRRIAGAYGQMADLLQSGVPLLRGLRLLGKSRADRPLAEVMSRIADRVADGDALADAMSGEPSVFPSVHVAMVRAGERGGFLESVFERLGVFLERQAALRARLLAALVYPAILLVVGTAVVAGALIFLVPQFRDVFGRIELPVPTKILLGASDLLSSHGLLLLGGLVVLAAILPALLRRPAVRLEGIRLLLRAPAIGPLLRATAVARFTRTLGTMLQNGIPLIQAMQISRDAAGNPILERAIDEAIEAVRAGDTLAEPLSKCGLFSDEIVEMISVGEAANNLPAVLLSTAERLETRIERMLGAVMSLVEPVLLLIIGGVVFFIFMALVVPILRMRSAI